ncbi:MAG TPA: glutaredoxin 3 [Myxococcota bacterium]|nr:glutaredoxin 3 [Myxococcota bacterium]
MTPVRIYTSVPCGYCNAAKRFFDERTIAFEEIDLSDDADARDALRRQTGQRTVPQIFVGEVHVGGYTDLIALARDGRLDELLNS